MQEDAKSVIVELRNNEAERSISCMKSITQNMRYLQSLMSYAQRYGVKAASRKYNRSRSFIYFWWKRWDGTEESLQYQSK